MDQIRQLLQFDSGTYAIPPPPIEYLYFFGGMLLLAVFLAVLPNAKRMGKNAYYKVRNIFWRGKRAMNDADRERQIIANLIVDALEEAQFQGVLSRRSVNKLYARLSKLGYMDLKRTKDLYKHLFSKLHPYKVGKLKEKIKERVSGEKPQKHQGLARLDSLEIRARRKLHAI